MSCPYQAEQAPAGSPRGEAIVSQEGAQLDFAGDMSYVLKVRVASPVALEELIAKVRAAANVSTRTTIVLSTPWE